MPYVVKEIFYSIQGEGAQTGRATIFCRFSGCNLWSGIEADRKNATCKFCDTDFGGSNGMGGGIFKSPNKLYQALIKTWDSMAISEHPFLVCTGGEPLLQLDGPLIQELHKHEFEIAVETNGTLPAPKRLDWICVSPKAKTKIILRHGDELKLVFPQEGLPPEKLDSLDFTYFFLQPMDGPDRENNTKLALEYCLKHPKWRLGLQTHKYLHIS